MPIENHPSAAERLELALSATQDAVAWTDEFGRVQWCNARFERVVERPRAEIVGANIIDLLSLERPGPRPLVEHPAGKVLKTRSQLSGCYELRREGAASYWDFFGAWLDADGNPAMAIFILRDVTTRRLAEQSASRLAAVVASTDDAVVICSLEGLVSSWNPSAERLFGYSAAEMQGKPVSLLEPQDKRGETERLAARARKGERVGHFETARLAKDGRLVEVALTVSSFRDEDGRVAGYSLLGRDVGEQLAARRRAARAELDLGRCLDGLSVMAAKLSPDGRFALANRALRETARTGLDELSRLRFDQAPWWPDAAARRRARGLFERALDGERVAELAHLKGPCEQALVCLTPLRDAAGRVDAVLAELRDVGAQTRAEHEARRLEDKLRLLVDNVQDYAIFMLDVDGRVASWNTGAERIKGWRAEEIVGRPYELFYTEEARARGEPDAALSEAARTGRFEREPVWRVRKDGTRFLAHVVITALRDERGALRGFAKITQDVTRRVEAEREQQKWETLFRRAGWGAAVVDPETDTLQAVNEGFARMHGYAPEELVGKPLSVAFDPAELPELERHLALVRERGHHIYEAMHIRKDGTRFPVMTDVSVFRDREDGRVLYRAAYFIDISERKRVEQALREKAEELVRSNQQLEQFASAASHDLLEPLRKITAFSDLLKRQSQAALDDKAKDFLERIRAAAARMTRLIEDLLAYSRVFGDSRPFDQVDLNGVVAGVLSDLETRLTDTKAEISVGKLPVVRAHAFQMRQLFQNLVANALKFQAAGAKPKVRIESRVPRPGFVEVTVSDNGIGFDQKDAERIFEPFLRLHTRAEFEGSGIGLAICRRIMMRHGGWISAAGERGKGSTFTITLPHGAPR